MFVLGCLLFFINDYISAANTSDSLLTSVKTTVSFGTSLGLIIITLAVFLGRIGPLHLHRYWVKLPVLGLGLSCLVFFIGDYFSLTNEGDSLLSSVRATVSFGTSLGLGMAVLVIFFYLFCYVLRELHSAFTPIALHLWRYRWIYVFVPILPSAAVILVSFDDFLRIETGLYRFLNIVLTIYISSLLATWHISLLYLITFRKWLCAAAIFILPPLSSVFFVYGDRYIKRSSEEHN